MISNALETLKNKDITGLEGLAGNHIVIYTHDNNIQNGTKNGIFIDKSGNNNHGNLEGTYSGDLWKQGYIDFKTGLDQCIGIPNITSQNTPSFTWELYTTVNKSIPLQIMMGFSNDGRWGGAVFLNHRDSPFLLNVSFFPGPGGGPGPSGNIGFSTSHLNMTDYYLFTVTYDFPSKQLKLYVNGQLQGSSTSTFATSVYYMRVMRGHTDHGWKSMEGRMIFFGLCNKALTQAEVLQNYNKIKEL